MEDNVEYAITKDAVGKTLAGDNMYSLHLPPNIPAKDYWSVLVYDSQTKLITKTDQPWPSIFKGCKRLLINQDGSVDIWFGPTPPAGNKNNWIQTIPGKNWTTMLRLYGALEACHDQTWRPGKIQIV